MHRTNTLLISALLATFCVAACADPAMSPSASVSRETGCWAYLVDAEHKPVQDRSGGFILTNCLRDSFTTNEVEFGPFQADAAFSYKPMVLRSLRVRSE